MRREDFPILNEKVHGRALVYLDNAATTQKPQVVIDAIAEAYGKWNANVHRGVHHLSQVATQKHGEDSSLHLCISLLRNFSTFLSSVIKNHSPITVVKNKNENKAIHQCLKANASNANIKILIVLLNTLDTFIFPNSLI